MQTVGAALKVPRSSASLIRFWFGRRKGFPAVERLVIISDTGAPVEVGVGDLKAALTYSNHRSIVSYSQQFLRIKFGTMSGSDVHSLFDVIQQFLFRVCVFLPSVWQFRRQNFAFCTT